MAGRARTRDINGENANSGSRCGGPRTKHVKHAAHVNTRHSRQSLCQSVSSRFIAQPAMDPPNMDALNLSDSDSDAMFDTPAARKTAKKAPDAGADAGEGAPGGKTRAKESHYTTEEAREAALRRELESIRNVNKVIEGVVESLQKAKDNMEVGTALRWNAPSLTLD
jgi:hypothetical protein